MIHFLNSIIKDLIVGPHYAHRDLAVQAKVAFNNIVSPIAFGITVYFNLWNTYNGLKDPILLSLDWLFSLGLLLGYLFFVWYKKERMYAHFLSIFQIIYLTELFYTGGVNGTAYIWFFLIGMSLIFFNDTLSGIYYLSSLLLITLLLSFFTDLTLVYPAEHLFRFYIVFILFVALMIVFQLFNRSIYAVYEKQTKELREKNEVLVRVVEEQKKLSAALNRKEVEKSSILKDLYAIINNTDDLIWYVSRDGLVSFHNSAFEKKIKLRLGLEVKADVFESIPKDKNLDSWLEKWRGRFFEAFNTPQKYTFEDVESFGGEVRYFKTDFFPVLEADTVRGIACFAKEVTQERLADKSKREAIVNNVDEERKRIASDLHDGLGQTLIAANLIAQTAEVNSDSDIINQVVKLIDQAIEESRNISHQIMPKSLEEFGLIPAIKSLIHKIENKDITIDFVASVNDDFRLPQMFENNLYRVAQESLANIIKHSAASTVEIQLVVHQKSLIFTVSDNGVGFEKNQSESDGIGLLNIKNRVSSLDGEFMLDSQKGKGTSLTIELPYVFNYEEY